ncbi:PepSY domain-containing protein, partial [Micromonospora sp. NPDC051296]|uniref:PepSY domain-containing protein n=1 Tax=Micromonospora sp. NPDC051296 TaxID=3155046 RepID=UPI003430ABF5
MKRNPLIMASVGGAAAVLAAAGVFLGITAADNDRAGQTTLTSATSDPTTIGVPDDDATPDDSGTFGTPGDPTNLPAEPSNVPANPGGAPAAPGSGAPGSGADVVSLKRAGEIALAHVGGGRITEIERDREHGRPVWEVEIIKGGTEHEIDIDRETGAVVKAE